MKIIGIISLVFVLLNFLFSSSFSQNNVPACYSNLSMKNGKVYFTYKGRDHKATENKLLEKKFFGDENINLENISAVPYGTKNGLKFDFKNNNLNGFLYYGFISTNNTKLPKVIYVNKKSEIKNGEAEINILKDMNEEYDIVDWQTKAKGLIGYRVTDNEGNILYDGRIAFKGTGPFTADKTITEGPFIGNLTHNEVIISFETNLDVACSLEIDGRKIQEEKPGMHHEIKVKDLKPGTEYQYKINYSENSQSFLFQTNPKPGSRNSFVFGYASDSRKGGGGGENDLYGVNNYILKRIASASNVLNVAFMQFTGDLVNGYVTDKNKINLQYSNWKHSVEPYASYFPVYTGIGNHEILFYPFLLLSDIKTPLMIDRFPFETESMEAVFAKNFVNPNNGPVSEDGTIYDPDHTKTDFPPYSETVYTYTYANTAMIVLNSDYWYTPQLTKYPETSGNLHGYIMDGQLEWLAKTLDLYEKDSTIDHVFITLHTPFFPNGGHSADAMWYSGNNDPRAIVAGKPLAKGIIERRDEILNLLVNKSLKTVAVLAGDEHNYSRTNITEDMKRYPENYKPEKISLKRNIWQITNGAAGAPYYAQEKLLWSDHVLFFTPQFAVVFFYVEGKKVRIEVMNPETMEIFDEAVLKEEIGK